MNQSNIIDSQGENTEFIGSSADTGNKKRKHSILDTNSQ